MAVDSNPLIASNFALEIQGTIQAYFRTVSGFNNNHEVVDHAMVDESGRQVFQKIPGELTWDDITLERGLTDDMTLWTWRQQVIDGLVEEARKDGSIVFYAQDGSEMSRFNFIKGWPSAWTGPDGDAAGSDVAVESITISHEGLTRAN